MPVNAEVVNPVELVKSEGFTIAERFPAGTDLQFMPGSYRAHPVCSLGGSGRQGFQDKELSQSGIKGLDILYSQTSFGVTTVGFNCEQDPSITSVQMLCKTVSHEGGEDTVTAGWSSNLLDSGRRLLGVSHHDIGQRAAMDGNRSSFHHPTLILRVTRDGAQEDVMVNTEWTGTADNWSVKADVQTGTLATKVS